MLFISDLPAPGLGNHTLSLLIAGLLLAAAIVAAGLWIVRKRQRALAWLFLLPISASPAFADIPAPQPRGHRVEMQIKLDYKAAGGPVLVIPAKLLPALQASATSDDMNSSMATPNIHTALAGAFLSMGIVLGGVWLVRFRHRPKPLAAIVAAALMAGSACFAGGVMWAQNIDNDYGHYSGGNLRKALDTTEPNDALQGTVAVQVDSNGEAILLLLPPPHHSPRPYIPLTPAVQRSATPAPTQK